MRSTILFQRDVRELTPRLMKQRVYVLRVEVRRAREREKEAAEVVASARQEMKERLEELEMMNSKRY